jgi:hypothetical protein
VSQSAQSNSPRASAIGAIASKNRPGAMHADAKEAYGGGGGKDHKEVKGHGSPRYMSDSKAGDTDAKAGAEEKSSVDLPQSGYIDYKTFRSLCDYLVQNLE